MNDEPMGHIRYALQWIVRDALAATPEGGTWVELGAGTGRGASFMARTLLDADRTDVKLYIIDPFEGIGQNGEQQKAASDPGYVNDWGTFLQYMLMYASTELLHCRILRCTSLEAARVVPRPSLVICDAEHSYRSVTSEIAEWWPRIIEHGVMGFDDMVGGSDVERAVFDAFSAEKIERRGNPHSAGDQFDWPTARVRKR